MFYSILMARVLSRIEGACFKHGNLALAANQLCVGQVVGGLVEWSTEWPGMSGHSGRRSRS